MRKNSRLKDTDQRDLDQQDVATPPEALKEPKLLIGEVLRARREQQGLSLAEISNLLNIRIGYLEALEIHDKSNLPEKVYTLGFLRSYAHFLGVDPQKCIDQFKREMYQENDNVHFTRPHSQKLFYKPTIRVFVYSSILAALAYGIWYYFF